ELAAGAGFIAADAMPRVEAGDVVFAPQDMILAADGAAVALEWVRTGGSTQATVVYDAEAFAPAEAARLAGQLGRVVESVVEHPEGAIGEIDLVGENERRRILFDFNDTEAEGRRTTVDALV